MKSLYVCGIFCLSLLFSCVTPTENKDTQIEIETVKKEIEIGRAAFAKIAGQYGIVKNQKATEYLNKIVKSLALYVERQEIDYKVAILATDQVNAYALPGGFILITLGTLKKVESPGALAGILAHELGHINHKHILDNVTIEVEYSAFETLARILAGSRQIITNAVNQINEEIAERLFIEGFAADDEYDADLYAVELLHVLGISSTSYKNFLLSLDNETGSDYLENLDKTHPPLQERIRKIEEQLAVDLQKLPITDRFKEFKEIISNIEIRTRGL